MPYYGVYQDLLFLTMFQGLDNSRYSMLLLLITNKGAVTPIFSEDTAPLFVTNKKSSVSGEEAKPLESPLPSLSQSYPSHQRSDP